MTLKVESISFGHLMALWDMVDCCNADDQTHNVRMLNNLGCLLGIQYAVLH